MKKQSFVKGAAFLAAAIALGKIFSAIFKIPLDRVFLHAEGMAVFNSAYNIYMLFFSVTTAGIPMAVSSLIASAENRDDENAVLSTSLIFTEGVLCIAFAFIFIFADFMAHLTGIELSALSFRAMAPALLFCGITASFRGYFQGKRDMRIPALSQVLDSFGKLFFGFLTAFILFSYPVHIISGGAMAGIPLGAMLSALLLLIAFIKTKVKIKLTFSGHILKKILFLAMPITITSSLHPLFNMADTLTVVPILSKTLPTAQAAFGHLSRAATLYALPVSVVGAVSSSILPAVSENLKNKNYKMVNYESSLAIRLAVLISAPCAAGFMAISSGILNLLYDNSSNHLALVFIAPSAVFASVGCVLACILQGMGKTKYTVFSALFACLGKVLLNPLLMHIMGVNGAATATTLSYFIFTLSLFIFSFFCSSLRFSVQDIIIKPFICAFLCFAAAALSSLYFAAPICIIIAAAVYIPSVFAVRLISLKEIKQIF